MLFSCFLTKTLIRTLEASLLCACLLCDFCLVWAGKSSGDLLEAGPSEADPPSHRSVLSGLAFVEKRTKEWTSDGLRAEAKKLTYSVSATGLQLFQVALSVCNPSWQRAVKNLGLQGVILENADGLLACYQEARQPGEQIDSFIRKVFSVLRSDPDHQLARPLLDDERFHGLFHKTIGLEEEALHNGKILLSRSIFTDMKEERGEKSFSFGLLSGYGGEGAGNWRNFSLCGPGGAACSFTYIQLGLAANKIREAGKKGLRAELAHFFPEDNEILLNGCPDPDIYDYLHEKYVEFQGAARVPWKDLFSKNHLLGREAWFLDKSLSLYGVALPFTESEQLFDKKPYVLFDPCFALDGKGEDFHPRLDLSRTPQGDGLIAILEKVR